MVREYKKKDSMSKEKYDEHLRKLHNASKRRYYRKKKQNELKEKDFENKEIIIKDEETKSNYESKNDLEIDDDKKLSKFFNIKQNILVDDNKFDKAKEIVYV